jgi:enamine deaminase RidA (YjgF/YER057c/UK114 family)
LQAFRNLANTLATVGLGLEDVVKVTIYLADTRDFMWMNMAMREVFPGDPPARVTVSARNILDTKIEIDAIAYREGSSNA